MDILADQAGGYSSAPSEQEVVYTDLLFIICGQFDIRCYDAASKERYFAEEIARVTWVQQQEQITGVKLALRPAFSARYAVAPWCPSGSKSITQPWKASSCPR